MKTIRAERDGLEIYTLIVEQPLSRKLIATATGEDAAGLIVDTLNEWFRQTEGVVALGRKA